MPLGQFCRSNESFVIHLTYKTDNDKEYFGSFIAHQMFDLRDSDVYKFKKVLQNAVSYASYQYAVYENTIRLVEFILPQNKRNAIDLSVELIKFFDECSKFEIASLSEILLNDPKVRSLRKIINFLDSSVR